MNQGSLETSQYHILKQDKIKDGKNEPKSIRNPDIQAKKPMEEKSPRLSCDNWGIDKGEEENNYHGNKTLLPPPALFGHSPFPDMTLVTLYLGASSNHPSAGRSCRVPQEQASTHG